ncbi:IS1 family transposase [Xenorhabdus bovienii]|uniref:IS1 family transposase n=1 Tax=Xenorhabdus bovienii TaxID=40576 RepID=UPI0023B2706B|nr:IS1 family transposase [Xenorhabdus bovienii]
MATTEVKCRFCHQTESVRKHGTGNGDRQSYRCLPCCRTFQLEYTYRACQSGTKKQVVDLAMNNADIRDTARALHTSINAVVRVLKSSPPLCVTTLPLDTPELQLICSSSVKLMKCGRLLGIKSSNVGYGMRGNPSCKRIIARVFGKLNKKTLKKLSQFNVAFLCTDNFSAYNLLLTNQYLIEKHFTQRIERENLTLCNRIKRLNRKALGYSKSPEMYDKIIGTFIEREYYV